MKNKCKLKLAFPKKPATIFPLYYFNLFISMKLSKNTNLYSRLSVIACAILVTGYAFVYAYSTILPAEYASGQKLTQTLITKIVGNIDELNTNL